MIDVLCKLIISGLLINKFVETGIYEGETTAQVAIWFSEFYPQFGKIKKLVIDGAKNRNPWNTYIPYPVFEESKPCSYKIYAVEKDLGYYRRAKKLFSSNRNIIINPGSSELFLEGLIEHDVAAVYDSIFFFLDAHPFSPNTEYWPLRDEIKQILRLPKFAIVVDDFAVPGRPECQYIKYSEDKACNWEYIRYLFQCRSVSVYYPMKSNRDFCGWALIISGYSQDETRFLDKLPLIRVD